jgi:hypothetical protein
MSAIRGVLTLVVISALQLIAARPAHAHVLVFKRLGRLEDLDIREDIDRGQQAVLGPPRNSHNPVPFSCLFRYPYESVFALKVFPWSFFLGFGPSSDYALRAIPLLFLADSLAARISPPFETPSFPTAMAFGFLAILAIDKGSSLRCGLTLPDCDSIRRRTRRCDR